MAQKNAFASIIFLFFFILSIFSGGEAQDAAAMTTTSPPAAGHCPNKEEISKQMIGLSEKTKEFLKENIIKRMDDNTLKAPDRECLKRFFNSYQAALGAIEQSIDDFSVERYSIASAKVSAYLQSVEDSLKCGPDVGIISNDYTEMERWAKFTAEDIINKLHGCKDNQ